jgi:hypothetical protein
MRRGIAFVLVVLAWPAVASGEVLCVPSTSIPGCPAGGSANEPTIQDAVNNGNSGDEILIGPDSANGGHPYDESVTDGATAYSFVGAGVGTTIIQGQGSPAMTVASGSTVTGLTVNLYSAPGDTGLSLAGSANDVAVTATGPLSTMNNIGVDLAGGSFSHGTVTLPLTGGDAAHYGGVIGSGSVADSSITAEVGITGDSSLDMPTVHRDTITANEGVVDDGTVTIDDSLVRTMPGPTGEVGIGMDPELLFGTITARHVTIVGSDSAGSVGLSADADGAASVATTTALLASSIVQGYGSSIDATATASPQLLRPVDRAHHRRLRCHRDDHARLRVRQPQPAVRERRGRRLPAPGRLARDRRRRPGDARRGRVEHRPSRQPARERGSQG